MTTMPSLFISHGAPTFAIEPGLAGAQLRALGQFLDLPGAVITGALQVFGPLLILAMHLLQLP